MAKLSGIDQELELNVFAESMLQRPSGVWADGPLQQLSGFLTNPLLCRGCVKSPPYVKVCGILLFALTLNQCWDWKKPEK